MAKWERVPRPEDQGGLGVINSKIMNKCLLIKWIWKTMRGSEDASFKLLEAKYMRDGNVFSSSIRGSS